MAEHVELKKVRKAVQTLKKLDHVWLETRKVKPLLQDEADRNVYLQISLKKIPYNTSTEKIVIPLKHPLVNERSDICMFTGDLNPKDSKADPEDTIHHYKDFFTSHGIKRTIEVIPLRKLRTEYQQFEAKRQLCNGFDLFLCDKKIYEVLPKLLGCKFFRKKKLPLKVNFESKDFKHHFENILCKTVLYITGEGSCCCIKVGSLDQTNKEISENVITACHALWKKIPGEEANISSVHLKTNKSTSLPIYMSFGSRNEVHLKAVESDSAEVKGFVSTVPGSKVSIKPDGHITIEVGRKKVIDKELKVLLDQQEKERKHASWEMISNFKKKQFRVKRKTEPHHGKEQKKKRKL